MRWLIPLAPIAEISNFTTETITSHDHYFHNTENFGDVWPWRSFKTSIHTPPHLNITRYEGNGELAEGYVFLSPSNYQSFDGTYETSGTGYIMTTEGDTIFAAEETRMDFCEYWVGGMTDFRVQTYNDRPHITYWNGCNVHGAHWGHRWGRVTFIDEEYNNFTINPDLKVVTHDEANRGQIDVHEHQMTDRNSMLVSSYNLTQVDLSHVGGPSDGWATNSIVFEIDIKTGEVLFEWKAMDHVTFAESKVLGDLRQKGKKKGTGPDHAWDFFHLNSIQAVGENYLISARNTWTIYLISGKDGSILRRLQGARHGFRFQHHARAHNVSSVGMVVSLYNNNSGGKSSEALAFHVPTDTRARPRLVRKLDVPSEHILGGTMGSYQLDIGNGNGLVGYGKAPYAREFGPVKADGTADLLWQVQFGNFKRAQNYRTFKSKWHGTPRHWDPVIVIEEPIPNENPQRAYVSWNGATDISGWAVFAGDNPGNLSSVGIAKKMGFETMFDLTDVNCVQVGAIRENDIIRRSNVACIHEVEDHKIEDVKTNNDEVDEQPQETSTAEPDIADPYVDGEVDEKVGTFDPLSLFLGAMISTIVFAAAIALYWVFRWSQKRRQAAYRRVASDFDERKLDTYADSEAYDRHMDEKDGRFSVGAEEFSDDGEDEATVR